MKPVSILYDMDMSGDCTNYGALAILHELCNRGEARLLATTICYDTVFGASCTDTLNKYYHREVPVGILHAHKLQQLTKFLEIVAGQCESRYLDGEPVPDAVDVSRRALAQEPDGSVTYVVCGSLSTAAALLDSEPDDISPLNGMELVSRKINAIYIMGGKFNAYDDKLHPEYNITLCIPGAKRVCEAWPGKVVFSAYEIGERILSFADFTMNGPKEHPARLAYEVYDLDKEHDTRSGRYSWDHTAVLAAVRPDRGYWDEHPYGRITVSDEGYTSWHAEENVKQTYLLPKLPPEEIGKVIDELILPH